MKNTKGVPEGANTVSPYLIGQGIPRLIQFLKQAFGAVEVERFDLPDGSVMHAAVRLGDSVVMMGEGGGQWKPMPAALHLYVEDCDATYKRALEAGATSVREPADQFYGDRNAGVTDPSGNQWWISQRIEDLTPAEIRRRHQEMMAKR